MSENSFRKYYAQSEFVAMNTVPVDAAQFETFLTTLSFSVPVVDAYELSGFVAVEFSALPSPGDIATLNAAVAAFVAQPATEEPLEVESLGITPATTSALVTVIDAATPPRAAGTYQISWTCLVGMLAAVTNTGVRGVITVTRTQGASVVTRTWEHNSSLQQPQTFSGCITFLCQQGATLRAHLQVSKVGTPAATAQMAVARITADKIG
jgi:hypothetical protein